jgi:hypothetical protein
MANFSVGIDSKTPVQVIEDEKFKKIEKEHGRTDQTVVEKSGGE